MDGILLEVKDGVLVATHKGISKEFALPQADSSDPGVPQPALDIASLLMLVDLVLKILAAFGLKLPTLPAS